MHRRWRPVLVLVALAACLAAGPVASRPAAAASPEETSSLEDEIARGDALEALIEAELQRQEELLQRMEEEQERPEKEGPASPAELSERLDSRAAPRAPQDRDLPLAIFNQEEIAIPKGQWRNPRELRVVKRTLDADRDGQAEQIRYFEATTGALIRKEQDSNYDGHIDSWSTYRKHSLVARELDTNEDDRPDVWERYEGGRMTSREIDRDSDGVKDAFYRYEDDSLVEERHDGNNDGNADFIVSYNDRRRVSAQEDSNGDGRIDVWTTYRGEAGKEVALRIERDSKHRGVRDVFETFRPHEGKAVLSQREEDVDGDGTIDVTSIYENGKLVRREIADPSLVPL